jgi:hypothetical protein
MSEQGTQEWRDERAGHVTASRISAVKAKPRSKGQSEATTRANYRAQLICETLSGKATEDEFESWDMKRGREVEPQARIEYELRCKERIQTVGFVKHPRITRAGASPDALVGDKGLAQFKCPKSATHLEWLLSGVVPMEHRPQMYFEMAVTGREWCDFVSYDPNMTGHELFVKRLMRDEGEIQLIENEVEKFLAEMDAMLNVLRKTDTDLEDKLVASIAEVEKRHGK